MYRYRVSLRLHVRPNESPSPPKCLTGQVLHEIYYEIQTDQICIVNCVALDPHGKLGYNQQDLEAAGWIERWIVPGGISFGKATVCETLYSPTCTGHLISKSDLLL